MASKKTPEQIIKTSICEWLSAQPDCLFWNNKSNAVWDPIRKIYRKTNGKYERNGVADILGIWDGDPLAIEVKSKSGKLSPDQARFLEDFKAHGGIAFVARSIDDCVKNLLRSGGTITAMD